jgi:tetratricopeptide (TPR) repeat protein
VVRARVLRSIGLVDKAISLLAEKGPFLPDPGLKAAVALELAECYAAGGDFTAAIEALGKAFASVEPGELAVQVGSKLAELCLRGNQPEQTMSMCSQLLSSATGDQRERLLRLQAEAYRAQKQYDRAVTVLLSQYGDRAAPTPTGPDLASRGQRGQ